MPVELSEPICAITIDDLPGSQNTTDDETAGDLVPRNSNGKLRARGIVTVVMTGSVVVAVP